VEVIRAPDHFQNGWKSKIHFQRLASGCTDAVASKDPDPRHCDDGSGFSFALC
jgi:hypothetical protein